MSRLYSTGPVENAAGNAAISLFVKALNIGETNDVKVEVIVYSINGVKTEIGETSLVVPPQSNEYYVFDVTDVLEYEVQIMVDNEHLALVSVWGKDANADLVAAQRFVQTELNIISNPLNKKAHPVSRVQGKSRARKRF